MFPSGEMDLHKFGWGYSGEEKEECLVLCLTWIVENSSRTTL